MPDEPVTAGASRSLLFLRRLWSRPSHDYPAAWDVFTSVSVVTVGILALAFAFVMPPFQFPDEHSHFFRAYQVSQGEFIGQPNPQIAPAIHAFLLQYPEGLSAKKDLPLEKSRPSAGAGPSSGSERPAADSAHKYLAWGVVATQLYCPILYLPASAGIGMARVVGASPLAMLYAARAMDVLSFLTAFVIFLLLAPDFRVLATAIALLPMTLHQAAAVTADQVTISVSLVGFAMILYARDHPVGRRYLAVLMVVFPLWALCKASFWALPLALLIPSARFGGPWKRVGYILGAAFAAMAAVGLWRELSHEAFAALPAAAVARGFDMQANAQILVHHPFIFLRQVVTWLHYDYPQLVRHFVGAFGWTQLGPPVWISFVVLAITLIVACVEATRQPFNAFERIVLLLTFGGALLQTYVLLFLIDGSYVGGQFEFMSAGVQGRYFIPFCLAGYLALKQNVFTLESRVLAPFVLSAETLYALVCLRIMGQAYRL